MADDPASVRTGGLLRAYLLASRAIPLLAGPLLRRRLARGKEDPARFREKLGVAGQPRPPGPLVWLHAVGLGEVLALRGLIAEMARQAPELSFLVTSTARSSALVMGANLPPRTQHQFLPLDAPGYLRPFLDHWRPDLSVWSEQELWPGAIVACAARGIPLALVNARITAESHGRRMRLRGLYRDLLARFALIAAQEEASAARLADLGAADVAVTGSLKSAAPPLAVDADELARLRAALKGRVLWVAASTHPGDETEAIAAARALPERLLILAPRDITRADAVEAACRAAGLTVARRSRGEVPGPDTRVWLADSYGEMGLWYRLCPVALVGGGFDALGGHNPWEPAALGAAVLHGPDTANFRDDYALLDGADAARMVAPGRLAAALEAGDLVQVAARARTFVDRAQTGLAPLAARLLDLRRAR